MTFVGAEIFHGACFIGNYYASKMNNTVNDNFIETVSGTAFLSPLKILYTVKNNRGIEKNKLFKLYNCMVLSSKMNPIIFLIYFYKSMRCSVTSLHSKYNFTYNNVTSI